jgi:hypothetical protein
MISAKDRSGEKDKKAMDLAIDGFIGGILAGLAMGLVLVVGEWILGITPGAVLGRFSPSGNSLPMTGALVHVAVSSIYGLVFGLLIFPVRKLIRRNLPVWTFGLVYGGILFLLAQSVFLSGIDSTLQAIPAWLFLLGHLVYGVLLGWWVGRN